MSNDAEQAVRRYLSFLADPKSIVDTALVSRLESEIASTTDLITKLKALAALEKANSINGESVRSGFVSHAKAFGQMHDIPASAFRALGVPDAVLNAAGIGISRGKATRTKSLPAGRMRAPKVAKSAIRQHILALAGPFTLSDVMDNVGGSIGTVNAVVKELVANKELAAIGPDPTHNGRGRAPIRYSR